MNMDNGKKIVILIGDGMADYPIESLGNRTPLEAARTPNMDSVAQQGLLGLIKTVPDGMQPGSDIANLSIFGYDPKKYFTGRAPLEALNMGIEMKPGDVAFRCNMVAVENGKMKDFSAGHVESGLSKVIIEELSRSITIKGIKFFPGVSYRNIMLWEECPFRDIMSTTPPHDIQGLDIDGYLPGGDCGKILREIMKKSEDILKNSGPVEAAKKTMKGNPTSIWLWGGGKKPAIRTLEEMYGLHGHTISAVDLVHGMGKAAGLTPLKVDGATGYIDTNYKGKAAALLEGIKKCNFIYLHVESPDESGHEGNLEHKIKAIEDFDEKVVGPVFEGLKSSGGFILAIMPDHPTPVKLRTHTADPVPFIIYSSGGWRTLGGKYSPAFSYNEAAAAKTGFFINDGHTLIQLLLNEGI